MVPAYDLMEERPIDEVINNFFFVSLLSETDRIHVAARLLVITYHNRCQNVVRTSVTHSAVATCATFLLLITFWRYLWSITVQMYGNMELLSMEFCLILSIPNARTRLPEEQWTLCQLCHLRIEEKLPVLHWKKNHFLNVTTETLPTSRKATERPTKRF